MEEIETAKQSEVKIWQNTKTEGIGKYIKVLKNSLTLAQCTLPSRN
jgi:hypothetical protein